MLLSYYNYKSNDYPDKLFFFWQKIELNIEKGLLLTEFNISTDIILLLLQQSIDSLTK